MKKILTTLLLLIVYCNNSFAEDFPLARKLSKALDYKKLSFLDRSKMTCTVSIKASKETNFIEQLTCESNGSNSGCLMYFDRSGVKKNPENEVYCFSSFDLLAAN